MNSEKFRAKFEKIQNYSETEFVSTIQCFLKLKHSKLKSLELTSKVLIIA
jgi:hypothetical protein